MLIYMCKDRVLVKITTLGIESFLPFGEYKEYIQWVLEVCRYICAIGGKNIIVTHRGLKGTLELLAAHNMTDYFAGCLTRDDGYPRKPDPAIFEAAIAKYHLKPEETLTVGDREIDIAAGQAAGILSCFYGTTSENVKADLVISNFEDLYRFLKGDQ